ncbi:MAG: glutamine--fructose-6-phosphate transaminase (isomerizing), partial [Bacilli bacterium]|nr:glutamine--fructose-6-phosphate transaminase (isomerizing) [Bacilli bacterium]
MCGITGYIGHKKAIPVLIDSLSNLEYRGYDSAGIAYIENNKTKITKSVGKIIDLKNKIKDSNSLIGIGHTRWATHGKPSIVNSHPHKVGKVTIVHNGIIENYELLKQNLIKDGYTFKSDTDTEVIAALIDNFYKETNNEIISLKKAQELLTGSYALGILFENENNIYCMKKDSPLVLGIGKAETFLASDICAFIKNTNQYIILKNHDIGVLKQDEITIYDNQLNKVNRQIEECNYKLNTIDKKGFDHYMLKEIHEQPGIIRNIFNNASLLKTINKIPFKKYKQFDIVACGSAYHTGLIAKSLIEEFADITVNVEIASEYRYKKLLNTKNKLVIFISQSGETADTLACLNLVKENKIDSLAIVNVFNSSIARGADTVLYTNAGPEIAVATTKAYSAQIAILILLTIKLGKVKIEKEAIKELPLLMEKLINFDYKAIAKILYKNEDIFFIGRKIDFALAMEGSLKLKEISYIHSEAYPAGELKHGTISLIEKNMPVIGILTDESILEKTISNLKETEARGANIITISNRKENIFNYSIHI